jgi:hypothetical protein
MRKIIIICLLAFAGFSIRAQDIPLGTVVGGGITVPDAQTDIPTHYDVLGKGGYRSVLTISARDSIKASRRSDGMIVFVRETGQWFQLGEGLTNADWRILSVSVSAIVDAVVGSDTAEYHLYPMVRAGEKIYFPKSFPDALYYIQVSCYNRFGTIPFIITEKKPGYFAFRPVETCTCTYQAKQIK